MESIFENFIGQLDGLLTSVPFIFCLLLCGLWGICSVLFCPCHLASIPMIISYIRNQENMTLGYAFRLAIVFSTAIFFVICIIGLTTIGLGKVLEESGKVLDIIIGIIFIIVGLHITGIIKYHHHDHCHEEEHNAHCGALAVKINRKGYIGAFIYGLLFGILLAPCTFAYMAPVMGVAIKKAATSQIQGFLMFVCYGIGNVAIIIFAEVFSEIIVKYNHWSHDSKAANLIKIICGILIIIAGIHMFFE